MTLSLAGNAFLLATFVLLLNPEIISIYTYRYLSILCTRHETTLYFCQFSILSQYLLEIYTYDKQSICQDLLYLFTLTDYRYT